MGDLLEHHQEVIHLAYTTVPNTSFENPLADLLQNLPPTVQLFSEMAARGDTSPEPWLLGSSDYGGALAAQLSLRFAFAHFISARGRRGGARLPRSVPPFSARSSAPLARVRFRDLREDSRRGRAPRREHRSQAPAHGEGHRLAGADSR